MRINLRGIYDQEIEKVGPTVWRHAKEDEELTLFDKVSLEKSNFDEKISHISFKFFKEYKTEVVEVAIDTDGDVWCGDSDNVPIYLDRERYDYVHQLIKKFEVKDEI